MNDIMYLYFDFDQKDQQAVDAIEKLLPGVDALLKDKGWEYTGFQNMYRPVKGTDPDETFDAAMKAVEEADYLKGYKPFFKVGMLTNACGLEEIIIQYEEPLDEEKLRRYREYYEETKQYAHGIIVDENHVLMDGYMTYLIAKGETYPPQIVQVRRGQQFRKAVGGKYIGGDEQRHGWYYDHGPAVVPGDVIAVPENEGVMQMLVERVFYVAGKHDCEKYKAITESEPHEKQERDENGQAAETDRDI